MKSFLLFLIVILSTCRSAFPMESPAQNVRDYYKIAKKFESEENIDQALNAYGKIVSINIPPAKPRYRMMWSDPDRDARRIQQESLKKISNIALKLENNKQYKQALEVYQLAPTAFPSKIQTLQKLINEKDEQRQLEELQQLERLQPRIKLEEAKEFARQKKYQDAYDILNKLIAHGFYEADQLAKEIIAQEKADEREQERQEQLTDEVQQKLKNVLILFTDTLKLLIKNM